MMPVYPVSHWGVARRLSTQAPLNLPLYRDSIAFSCDRYSHTNEKTRIMGPTLTLSGYPGILCVERG